MGNWGKFEFNDSYEGEEIGKVNNVILPEQYIEFMRKHNGGEGDIESLPERVNDLWR